MKRNEMLKLLRFYVVVGITATCLFMLLDSAGLSSRASQGVPLALTCMFVVYWRLFRGSE